MSHRTCSFEGCERKFYARNLCASHYQARRVGAPLIPLDGVERDDARFARHTEILPNGCVRWTGSLSGGYGQFRAGGKTQKAHRWKWQRDNGPLGLEFDLDHYRYPELGCIGPACVAHVRPVTRLENVLRGRSIQAWNRAKTHCPQGHPYSGENVRISPGGGRYCRTCSRDESRKRDGYKGNPPAAERTHCPQGHAYDVENTHVYNGSRCCRACGRIRARARRAARKAARQA